MTRRLVPGVALVVLLTGCAGGASPGSRAMSGPRSAPAVSPHSAPSSPRGVFRPRRAIARLSTWDLPYAVAREAVIPVGGSSVMVAGGLLPGDVTTDHVARVDLVSGGTRAMPALATPVHDTAGGVVDGHPTLVGGGNTTGLAVEQSWVRHSWRNIGNLPTTRSDLSVVEWHHHAYAVGGFDGTSQPTSVLRLGLRGAVRPVARLRQGVRYAATVRVGASVFVLGGEVVGRELDTVQQIHLATGQVTTPSRLPVPLGHAMAADVGDRILLMGGRITPDRQTDAMWWFDPGTGRFTRAGRLPTPLSDAAVATHGRRTWLLGGETPAITRTVTEIRFR